MKDSRYDRAEGRVGGLSDTEEEDQLSTEQAETDIGVDGGSVTLGTPEGQEDVEADSEAEHADGAAGVGEDVQVVLVLVAGGQAVDIHQDREVGEVIALTPGGVEVRLAGQTQGLVSKSLSYLF